MRWKSKTAARRERKKNCKRKSTRKPFCINYVNNEEECFNAIKKKPLNDVPESQLLPIIFYDKLKRLT